MSMYMPGATAVGITFDGGVVFASEKRIAFGNFLVSKSTKKTFPITSKVGAALEVKRKDYANTFVSNVSKEEADGV